MYLDDARPQPHGGQVTRNFDRKANALICLIGLENGYRVASRGNLRQNGAEFIDIIDDDVEFLEENRWIPVSFRMLARFQQIQQLFQPRLAQRREAGEPRGDQALAIL